MLATFFPWKYHRTLIAGLLLSLCLFATPLTGSSPDTGSSAGDIDLRPAFKKWELGPRLQGKRGTCSVFTVVGALEYALASKQGRGTQLSVEYLNWASNEAVGKMRDGGFFSDLWKGFTAYGICPEQDMPYQNEFNPNRKPSEEAKEHARQALKTDYRLHWIKRWNPNAGLSKKQLLAIKQTLSRKWPVCGGFRWPRNPVRWKDDVLEMPPPEGVVDGHSILLVGYRNNPKQAGGGVFVFRDSNNNGREGYMTYEYASAYMNDAVWIDYKTDYEE